MTEVERGVTASADKAEVRSRREERVAPMMMRDSGRDCDYYYLISCFLWEELRKVVREWRVDRVRVVVCG